MSYQDLIPISNICQSSIVFIGLMAYIPQWITIYRRKSSRNISIYSWVLWSLASVFAVFYAVVQFKVYGTGTALVFTSTASLCFVFVTVVLIYCYRHEEDRSRRNPELGVEEHIVEQITQAASSAVRSIEEISISDTLILPPMKEDSQEVTDPD
jgi:uncharacterized protein with PQ loop repeat